MTTCEEWEKLLKVDSTSKAALLALFRETFDFSEIDEPIQQVLIQSMATVLNDEDYDFSLIFDEDEIVLPFDYNENDNETLRQWVLVMWEHCAGHEFEVRSADPSNVT